MSCIVRIPAEKPSERKLRAVRDQIPATPVPSTPLADAPIVEKVITL